MLVDTEGDDDSNGAGDVSSRDGLNVAVTERKALSDGRGNAEFVGNADGEGVTVDKGKLDASGVLLGEGCCGPTLKSFSTVNVGETLLVGGKETFSTICGELETWNKVSDEDSSGLNIKSISSVGVEKIVSSRKNVCSVSSGTSDASRSENEDSSGSLLMISSLVGVNIGSSLNENISSVAVGSSVISELSPNESSYGLALDKISSVGAGVILSLMINSSSRSTGDSKLSTISIVEDCSVPSSAVGVNKSLSLNELEMSLLGSGITEEVTLEIASSDSISGETSSVAKRPSSLSDPGVEMGPNDCFGPIVEGTENVGDDIGLLEA